MKKQTTKLHFTGEDLRNESVKKAAEKGFGKKEIVEEVKAPTALKQKVIMKGAVFSATAKAHQEVAEHEDDNVGVQAVNETEGAVETAAQTADTVRYSHKLKAYKQAAKLESKADKANIETRRRLRIRSRGGGRSRLSKRSMRRSRPDRHLPERLLHLRSEAPGRQPVPERP